VVVEERISLRGDLVVDGLTTLDDFSEKTGLLLPEGPYDTLAGYFMARLGQLPAVGDTVSADVKLRDSSEDSTLAQIELKVTELDGRRAATFMVRRRDGADFSSPPDPS